VCVSVCRASELQTCATGQEAKRRSMYDLFFVSMLETHRGKGLLGFSIGGCDIYRGVTLIHIQVTIITTSDLG